MLAAGILGCANPPNDFATASKSGTIESYEAFISKHPKAGFLTDEAYRQISLLRAWQKAQSTDDAAGYRAFLASHPHSQFTDLARQRLRPLEVKEAWGTATSQDSVAAYQDFLRKNPSSEFTAEAKARLDRAEGRESESKWRSLESSGSPYDFAAFVVEYPSSPSSNNARSRLATIFRTAKLPASIEVGSTKAFAEAAGCRARLANVQREIETTARSIELRDGNIVTKPIRVTAKPGLAFVTVVVSFDCSKGADAKKLRPSSTPLLIDPEGAVYTLPQYWAEVVEDPTGSHHKFTLQAELPRTPQLIGLMGTVSFALPIAKE
jgi:hypothetical protein